MLVKRREEKREGPAAAAASSRTGSTVDEWSGGGRREGEGVQRRPSLSRRPRRARRTRRSCATPRRRRRPTRGKGKKCPNGKKGGCYECGNRDELHACDCSFFFESIRSFPPIYSSIRCCIHLKHSPPIESPRHSPLSVGRFALEQPSVLRHLAAQQARFRHAWRRASFLPHSPGAAASRRAEGSLTSSALSSLSSAEVSSCDSGA